MAGVRASKRGSGQSKPAPVEQKTEAQPGVTQSATLADKATQPQHWRVPEGPEIRRAADQIEKVVLGQKATEVFFAFDRLKDYERDLAGRTVTAVETRGKAMLSWFDDKLAVYSHNQLYGRWMLRKKPGLPKTGRQLRFAIHTENGAALLYSASQIEVLDKRSIRTHPFLSKLGPDLLHKDTTPRKIKQRLTSPAFHRRHLAALLLDQGFVAGIGNYLRSEIMFEANLHPSLRPVDLDETQKAELARCIHAVTKRAYQSGGITTPAAFAKAMKQRGHRKRDYRHHVFSRVGHPCRTCSSQVERETLAGRRLYYCPTCQSVP